MASRSCANSTRSTAENRPRSPGCGSSGGPEKSDDLPLESCTIITTDANELARQVHDRMPVILDLPDYDAWLDPANQDVAYMLDQIPPDRMTVRPVARSSTMLAMRGVWQK